MVEVKTLLDHGSHLILIRPEIANDLNLTQHTLTNPEHIQVALQSESPKNIVLNEYVHLCLSDSSFCWTSHTVHAAIAPHLSVPVLLGLPFLVHNQIIIDHELRTTVNKGAKFNLLHPMPRHDSTKAKSPKAKCDETLRDR